MRMDWKKLIQDLLDQGMSQAEIADGIGIKQPSLNEILNSDTRTDVRWRTGDKLIALHKRVMKRVNKKAA